MTDSNDVPGEMHTPTPDHDDYQPGTEPGLDAMFAELSRAAHAGSPVEPSDALQSFVSIGRVDVSDAATGDVVHDLGTVPMGAGAAPETPRRKPLLSTLTALVASATGKLVLTGGLAAASVAGAHSAGVVDVPLLPDVSEPAVVVVQDDESSADAEFAAQTDSSTTTVPAADDTDDSSDDRMDNDVDSSDDDLDGIDATVTLTINGEEVELTDDEIDAFLDDFETNIEENTEAWEAAVAACEAAFDAVAPDAGAAPIDPADIDAFMAQIDAAMQTCFDAIDAAGFAGPLSGLDLDDIKDFDLDLDLDEFDLDFDLDDLFDEDFPFDTLDGLDLENLDLDDLDLDDLLDEDFPFGDHDGFPIDPEAFGEFDFDDFDFGELPFDPSDPDGVQQWLEDQGFDLDFDLSELDGLGEDGFDFDELDDLLDQFEDEWDAFEDDWDELEDDLDELDDELDDLTDDELDDLFDDLEDDLDDIDS